MNSNWNNLVARRDLLQELVVSELKTSQAGTVLGWMWWLLDPLLMMLIYWGVFTILLGRGREMYAPYPIFLLCALLPWKHLSSSAGKATSVLRSREPLIKSVPFPTMVLPLSQIIAGFAYFVFGFAVLLAAAAIWPNPQHSGNLVPLVQAPLLMVLQVAVIAGICLALSAFGVLVRDLSNFMTHLLRVGFYITPGLFGIDMVEKTMLAKLGPSTGSICYSIYLLNPFALLISGYRDSVFYGRFIPIEFWIILLIEAGILLYVGNLIYQHYDRRVIKFL